MVKYLCSYMNDRKNKDLQFPICIKTQVEKYKRKFPEKKPVVIFDFMACLQIGVEHDFEVFCGGRLPKCTEQFTKFCQTFQQLGVEMTFFLDGPIKQHKMPKFLENSNSKYITQQDFFEAIREEKKMPYLNKGKKLSIYFYNFLSVARKYGKIFISLENECDIDIAEYASRIKAMAVFTPDTDFLIYPMDWWIWNSYKFNLRSFRTVSWNKRNLRLKLNLKQQQMPIFSTLSGNDFIKLEEIKHFMDNLPGDKPIQEKIAKYIADNFPNGVYFGKGEFEKLVAIFYNNGNNGYSKTTAEKKVQQSLDFYNYKKRKVVKIEAWLKSHVQYTNSTIVYMILKNFPITINQSWIDLALPNTKPYSEIVIPILQRQMGIILYMEKKFNPKRTLYFKPSHEEPFQSKVFQAIYPDDINVPAISDILYFKIPTEVDENPENASAIGFEEVIPLEMKFILLAWVISPTGTDRMDYLKLLKLSNTPFLIVGIILWILVKEKQISIDEADVVLLSINEALISSSAKLNSLTPPTRFQQRPFWISFVFNRLFEVVRNVLITCGLFKFLLESSFDGYIFHKMYEKFLSFNDEEKNSLTEKLENFRIYID